MFLNYKSEKKFPIVIIFSDQLGITTTYMSCKCHDDTSKTKKKLSIHFPGLERAPGLRARLYSL